MAKRDAKKRAHGDGPYREAPLTPPPEKKPWWLWALLASAALRPAGPPELASLQGCSAPSGASVGSLGCF